MKKITVIDLFSGAGGFSEGFMQTGHYDFLAHVEWEKPMVDTLRENLIKRWGYSEQDALNRVIHFDIQKTDELINGKWDSESIKKYKGNAPIVMEKGINGLLNGKQVDLIIGGPPCQAYSIAGRTGDKNKMKDDYRNYLFESFVKVVNQYKPKLFVFENVTGILSAKPNDKLIIESIYEAFNEIGYQIVEPNKMKSIVYSTANFNVPQDRKRIIIVGINKEYQQNQNNAIGLDEVYEYINELKSEKITTVQDAIGHLPKIYPLETPQKINHKNVSHYSENNSDPLHTPRYNNQRDIQAFKQWIENNMNKASKEQKLAFYKSITGKTTNISKYRNLEWNKPSPTILAHLQKDGMQFIHPDKEQARTITIREAAILQSFPLDYHFVGSTPYCFKMIGNAVPVSFAKSIATAIHSLFKKKNIID